MPHGFRGRPSLLHLQQCLVCMTCTGVRTPAPLCARVALRLARQVEAFAGHPGRKSAGITATGSCAQVPKFEGDIFGEEGQALTKKYHGIFKEALLALYQENKDEFHANRREELKIIA